MLLLKFLSDKNECHVISLQTSNDQKIKTVLLNKLSEFGIPNITLINTSRNFTSQLFLSHLSNYFGNLIDDPFKDLIKASIINKYDIVHVEGFLHSAYTNLLPKNNTVFSSIDAISLRQKRLAQNESKILKKIPFKMREMICLVIENFFCRQVAFVHVHSDEDAQYLKKNSPRAEIFSNSVMVPNEYFLNKKATNIVNNENINILFLGNLEIQYIREGLMEFLEMYKHDRCEKLTLTVLGRSADVFSANLKKELKINIKFLSWVENYNEFISKYDVIVLPDKMGTGIKNRTLQAMALGKVVVGTESAFQGIPITNSVHGFVVSSIIELYETVIYLSNNMDNFFAIGSNANTFVKERNSQDIICNRWIRLYKSMENQKRENHPT